MGNLKKKSLGVLVVPVMYAGDQVAPLKYNEQSGRSTVNRTVMIDNFLLDIQHKKINAMRRFQFEQFANDMLNV